MTEESVLPGLPRYWFAAITGGVPVLCAMALFVAEEMVLGRFGGPGAATPFSLAPRAALLAVARGTFITGGIIMVGLLVVGPTMLLFAALMRGAEARTDHARTLPAWWLGGLVAAVPIAFLPTAVLAHGGATRWIGTMLTAGVVAATIAWLVRRRWR
ncbi:hypothetical protein [uncultured Sphingomonas sp.]|uniref:hypothetical protein n=1 Tax=uncultured Sphingomonas sp. TaxID=158754 RepID=UPI0035CA9425